MTYSRGKVSANSTEDSKNYHIFFKNSMLPSDLIGGVVCWSQATHLASKAGAVEGTSDRFLVKVIPGSLVLLLDYVGAGATSYNGSSSGVNMSWLSANESCMEQV